MVPILSAMRSPGEFTAALVMSVALLVSCSDPQAGTLPTPSPTAPKTTQSPSPSAAAEDEVRQAVNDYFVALNQALRHPITGADSLSSYIAPECTCAEIIEVLKRLARAGEYLDYKYSVRDLRIQQVGGLGASVTYIVDQTAGHKRKNNGQVVATYPATTARYSAHLARRHDQWLLDRVDRQK